MSTGQEEDEVYVCLRTEMAFVYKGATLDSAPQVRAPGMQPLKVAADLSGRQIHQAQVWGWKVDGVDCGDDAGLWFDKFLNQKGT